MKKNNLIIKNNVTKKIYLKVIFRKQLKKFIESKIKNYY